MTTNKGSCFPHRKGRRNSRNQAEEPGPVRSLRLCCCFPCVRDAHEATIKQSCAEPNVPTGVQATSHCASILCVPRLGTRRARSRSKLLGLLLSTKTELSGEAPDTAAPQMLSTSKVELASFCADTRVPGGCSKVTRRLGVDTRCQGQGSSSQRSELGAQLLVQPQNQTRGTTSSRTPRHHVAALLAHPRPFLAPCAKPHQLSSPSQALPSPSHRVQLQSPTSPTHSSHLRPKSTRAAPKPSKLRRERAGICDCLAEIQCAMPHFTVRVTKPQHRLPREVVKSPSLETFQSLLDTVRGNWL